MVDLLRKNLYLFLLIFSILFFFQKIFISGLLPVPTDTIVGLYYPFRDIYAKDYPRGIPYKNFLITDPVRQTYPWRTLVTEMERKFTLPLWNPYNFAGTPLLANFQSASFYPLNILFFLLPTSASWTILILSQPLLAGIFMFLFLNNLKLRKEASFLGAVSFSFCGFFIAWLEWGNVVSTSLWLPLVLFSIDKIIEKNKERKTTLNLKSIGWPAVLLFSLLSSFFAGHLQIFFYILILASFYLGFRSFNNKINLMAVIRFFAVFIVFVLVTSIQWIPTLQLISLSARNADLISYNSPGWFVPWQHLIQFIIPDFFGNPATLNYWGVWNYGELIGYVGMFPLLLAVLAIIFRKDKNVFFFAGALILSLILALPTPLAKLPFFFHIPLLETSQPTRLIFLADFSLASLSALGLDYYLKKGRGVNYILGIFAVLFIGLWVFVFGHGFNLTTITNVSVTKQNLILPTLIFLSLFAILILRSATSKLKTPASQVLLVFLIGISIFDLFRFGWKFETFAKKDYLFPGSSVLTYLQNQREPYRVMATDSQILPPNFSAVYHIQTADGYDPLYLRRFGELMAAYSRSRPDISAPFGFNRIITPQSVNSDIINLLGIKYVLSFTDLDAGKFKQVFTDGTVKVFENRNVLPRAFFVFYAQVASNKQDAINALFDSKYPLTDRAIVEDPGDKNILSGHWSKGTATFNTYSENKVVVDTKSPGKSFLVLTDAYYPTWRARIDGKDSKIYLADYAFRGVIIPAGNHRIEFYNTLF